MHKKKGPLIQREETKSWIVGTMVASLNYPLHTFNHPVHRTSFKLMRLGPMNESIARRCTDNEAQRAIRVVKLDMQKLRAVDTVFTLTADEWTWQRKRFLGVTLHTSSPIPSLGRKSFQLLARFRDKATATNLLKSIQSCLERVGLEIEDVRGITTDGAAVMKKLGRQVKTLVWPKPFFHQLCLAHALHLAVLDSYGGKKWPDSVILEEPEEEGAEDGEVGQEIATWQLVAMPDGEDACEEDQDVLEAEEQLAGVPIIRGPPGTLVAKVRKVCQSFHKSGSMNDQLLERSGQAENCAPHKCALDVKTRWNSTLRMLRSFIESIDSIRAVYEANVKKTPWPITAEDIEGILELISTLKIVEKASKRLSDAELTMRNADIALEIMLRGVKEKETDFAKALYKNLCSRILQRRGAASRLARYLQRKSEMTPMDAYLENMRATFNAEEQQTFAEPGNINEEIAAFMRLEAESKRRQPAPAQASAADEDDGPIGKGPSPEDLMGMHHRGAKRVFPDSMRKTLEALQPSSVPAERSFSVARHARRFSQESMSDDRFENYLFLKYFYEADKPWVKLSEILDE